MEVGHFYFLDNQYYQDFNDDKLMSNHEIVNGKIHDRPCYCCIDTSDSNIYWVIPISSQVEKYRKIYNKKIGKNGKCDTIDFGKVLGAERAFLIQNMCPVTDKYIKNEYQHLGSPVAIDYTTYKRIVSKATKVSALVHNNNSHLIFPDVLKIEEVLKSKNK
jgi:hypothetical protein